MSSIRYLKAMQKMVKFTASQMSGDTGGAPAGTAAAATPTVDGQLVVQGDPVDDVEELTRRQLRMFDLPDEDSPMYAEELAQKVAAIQSVGSFSKERFPGETDEMYLLRMGDIASRMPTKADVAGDQAVKERARLRTNLLKIASAKDTDTIMRNSRLQDAKAVAHINRHWAGIIREIKKNYTSVSPRDMIEIMLTLYKFVPDPNFNPGVDRGEVVEEPEEFEREQSDFRSRFEFTRNGDVLDKSGKTLRQWDIDNDPEFADLKRTYGTLENVKTRLFQDFEEDDATLPTYAPPARTEEQMMNDNDYDATEVEPYDGYEYYDASEEPAEERSFLVLTDQFRVEGNTLIDNESGMPILADEFNADEQYAALRKEFGTITQLKTAVKTMPVEEDAFEPVAEGEEGAFDSAAEDDIPPAVRSLTAEYMTGPNRGVYEVETSARIYAGVYNTDPAFEQYRTMYRNITAFYDALKAEEGGQAGPAEEEEEVEGDGFGRRRGHGLNGFRSITKTHTIRGRGTMAKVGEIGIKPKSTPTHAQFGKFLLSLDRLDEMKLRVVYDKTHNNIKSLPLRSISEDLHDLLEQLILSGKFNERLFLALAPAERALTKELLTKSGVAAILKIKLPDDKDELAAKKERFELLSAQVNAGNDSPLHFVEMKGILGWLRDRGHMSTQAYNSMMRELE